jgi:hypothetical protein
MLLNRARRKNEASHCSERHNVDLMDTVRSKHILLQQFMTRFAATI